jgi:hypothetical protein
MGNDFHEDSSPTTSWLLRANNMSTLEIDGVDTIFSALGRGGNNVVVTPPSAMMNLDENNEGWDLAAIFN